MSLVSQHHASYVAQACSNLKFQKLSSPMPVTVASLFCVATMEVPITWTSGKEGIFVMLVVPGLAWPIFFYNSYLAATESTVSHAKLKVHFGHLSLH